MKKLFYVLIAFTLAACSNDNDLSENTPLYKIHDGNIHGVWKSNDNSFVSFSSENYNSSLLSNTFIDEGDFIIKGDTITVSNHYFNRTTKYVVKSLDGNKMLVSVSYSDLWSGEKTSTMQLTKTEEQPCTKKHNLLGKSFYAQYAAHSGSQHWNKEFVTYNSMSCTRTDVSKSTPFTCYYIYLAPRIYFYVIRNGEFYYDTVRYGDVVFNDDNQIESLGKLYGEKYE